MITIGWWWWEQPKTPKEIFEVRCSTCHEFPDITPFEDHQIPLLVKTMREKHGASEVIDDQEAEMIVDYILAQRRQNERSQENR
jgi:hypothetical protein